MRQSQSVRSYSIPEASKSKMKKKRAMNKPTEPTTETKTLNVVGERKTWHGKDAGKSLDNDNIKRSIVPPCWTKLGTSSGETCVGLTFPTLRNGQATFQFWIMIWGAPETHAHLRSLSSRCGLNYVFPSGCSLA